MRPISYEDKHLKPMYDRAMKKLKDIPESNRSLLMQVAYEEARCVVFLHAGFPLTRQYTGNGPLPSLRSPTRTAMRQPSILVLSRPLFASATLIKQFGK